MTVLSRISADICVVNRSKSFSCLRGRLVEDRFFKRMNKTLDSSYSNKKALETINYVQEKIHRFQNNPKLQDTLLQLGNKIISIFFSSSAVKKALLVLDRVLAFLRHNHEFLLKENKRLYKKWQSYGFKSEFFYRYGEFSNFLMSSTLASQMKITNDPIKEIAGEPAILVEGKWTKFSDLRKRFSYKYSSKYKEVFLYEKSTNQVFTYLPNKQGLSLHHPYLNAFKPVGKLSSSEYKKVLKKAVKFERNYKGEKKNYKHILQIVTSQISEDSCFYNKTNFARFFRTKHPYFRLIDANTKEVYILGYGLWRQGGINFLTNLIGRFRSLDVWEYKNCRRKYVTNIAIDEEEIKRFFYYCKKFINDDINFGSKIAFNYMKQNCTSFIKEAMKYVLKEQVITNLKIDELIYYIAPDFIRRIGILIKRIVLSFKDRIILLFPEFIKTQMSYVALLARKCWSSFVAFCLSIIATFFGGISGTKARKLKNPDKQIKLYPPLQNVFHWFNYYSFNVDLPGKLLLWQLKQKSTVTFNNPRTLTIVPN